MQYRNRAGGKTLKAPAEICKARPAAYNTAADVCDATVLPMEIMLTPSLSLKILSYFTVAKQL